MAMFQQQSTNPKQKSRFPGQTPPREPPPLSGVTQQGPLPQPSQGPSTAPQIGAQSASQPWTDAPAGGGAKAANTTPTFQMPMGTFPGIAQAGGLPGGGVNQGPQTTPDMDFGPGAMADAIAGGYDNLHGESNPKDSQGKGSGWWTTTPAGSFSDVAPDADSGADEPIDFQQRFDDMWGETQAQYEGALGDMLEGTYADEAAAGRRNAEMNALAGGGMGGAFAGGQAQVALGGMQQRLKARQDWAKRGLELKMTYLQHMLRQAEAEKDRDLQQWLQAEADKTALEIAGMQATQAELDREAQKESMDRANDAAEAEANEPNWLQEDYYTNSGLEDFVNNTTDKLNPFD